MAAKEWIWKGKCKCLTNENISLCTWEDFRVYQAYHDIDEFDALKPWMKHVHQMNVADYILGNSDRHEGNWGFLIDNETGEKSFTWPIFLIGKFGFDKGTKVERSIPKPMNFL